MVGLRIKVISCFMIILLINSIPYLPTGNSDPITFKSSDGWNVIWNFSDENDYVTNNSIIRAGHVEIRENDTFSIDDTVEDFKTGNSSNIKIINPGRLRLENVHGMGFTEFSRMAQVDIADSGSSVAWGDYNNDGYQDLFVGRSCRKNLLFKNNKNGTFTDISTIANISGPNCITGFSTVWGDFNNDNYLDLAEAPGDGGVMLWRNNRNGTFTEISNQSGLLSYGSPYNLVWLDYNNDGFLDLYEAGGQKEHLWQNNHDETFSDKILFSGLDDGGLIYSACSCDVNGDGWPDLLKTTRGVPFVYFQNNRDGTFTNRTATMNLSGVFDPQFIGQAGIACADINNDNKMDVYISLDSRGQGHNDLLLINMGDQFWEMAEQSGIIEKELNPSVSIADFDLDGYLDIFTSTPTFSSNRSLLWHNNGNGTFTNVGSAWGINTTTEAEGTGVADFDNDGDMDLYVAGWSGSYGYLFKNNFNSENVIKFRIVGYLSNRAAIGTRIQLYLKGTPNILKGMQEVQSGSGWGGTNSLEKIFGANTSNNYIAVIHFPNGKNVTIDNIQAPAYLQVNETGEIIKIPFNYDYNKIGNYTSRPIQVGKNINWGKINWSANVPIGTDIVIKTKSSPDELLWSAWSSSYINNETIKSPKNNFLQYWIQLSTKDSYFTPVLDWISIGIGRYSPNGSIILKPITFRPVALNVEFNHTDDEKGQTIDFFYSKDDGTNWKPIPVGGKLPDLFFSNIKLKAELRTTVANITPMLYEMKLHYFKNVIPQVQLISPNNGGLINGSVKLQWNGFDQDGDPLYYDLYLGNASNYTLIATNMTNNSYELFNIAVGTRYFWHVIVRDRYTDTNSSEIWSFSVNGPPEIVLLTPSNNSIIGSQRINFQWQGMDKEGQELIYYLFIGENGRFLNKINGTKKTEGDIRLSNRKSYQWYTTATDGYYTIKSETWNFTIVAPLNHPPIISEAPPLNATINEKYQYQLHIYDADNDNVSVTFNPGFPSPLGMNLTPGGKISWIPNALGSCIVSILLDDGKDIVEYYYNITVNKPFVNQAPIVKPISDILLKRNKASIQLNNYVTDDEPVTRIKWTFQGDTKGLFTILINGSNLTIIPTAKAYGKSNISLIAMDSHGAKGMTALNITVDNRQKDTMTISPIGYYIIIILIIGMILLYRYSGNCSRKRRGYSKKKVGAEKTNRRLKNQIIRKGNNGKQKRH